MNRELFSRLLLVLDIDELREVVRLQHEVEQAVDDVEFAIGGTPTDVIQIGGLMDIVVMNRYNLKLYLDELVVKYDQ